jgi:hypothetical protein
MEYKVKTKAEQKKYNKEFDKKYREAQKLNRHDRRALGKINRIGMIPKKP